jgi:Fe2+ or Zn2+ uptake regulation protein
MGKQLINQVQCQHCGKMFDINTEDIEWEHLEDRGESDVHAPLHDMSLLQKVICANPNCGKENTILYRALEDPKTGSIAHQEVTTI